MKYSRTIVRLLIILIFSLLFSVLSLQGAGKFPPPGDYPAGFFILEASKKAEQIAVRIKKALAADPVWLKAYMEEKQLKPGDMLPYHERLGITQEEYQLFVSSLNKLVLNQVAEVTVHVEKSAGKVTISIRGVDLPVSSFEFDSDEQQMSCALGTATGYADINQSDSNTPTGKWNGRQWGFEKGEPDSSGATDFTNLKFAFGVDEMSRNLIYLRIVGLKDGRKLNVGAIIRWPKE